MLIDFDRFCLLVDFLIGLLKVGYNVVGYVMVYIV